MQVQTRIYINSNPELKNYLKTHSYWYKLLNRNPLLIKNMEGEMKKEYKLTTEDKLKKMSNNINLVSNILNILNK